MKTRLSLYLQTQSRRAERLVRAHDSASSALREAISEPDQRVRRGENGRQFRLALDNHPKATKEAREYGKRAVTLSVPELHVILQAALPSARRKRTRTAHARLLTALKDLEHQIATLDSQTIDEETITAAQAMQHALDHWLKQAKTTQQSEVETALRAAERAKAAREAGEKPHRALRKLFKTAETERAGAPLSILGNMNHPGTVVLEPFTPNKKTAQ